MYNSLYYIFTKDYYDDYSNSTLYMKDKINKLKILNDSKDNELKYVKKKYESLSRRYNSLEWKYNELLLNTHYHRDYCNKLEIKYNNLIKKQKQNMCLIDINGDILSINDDFEHI
jgi:hypothetical protein